MKNKNLKAWNCNEKNGLAITFGSKTIMNKILNLAQANAKKTEPMTSQLFSHLRKINCKQDQVSC